MVVTYALVQAAPAHVYKSFPPSHKVKALTEKKTVPSEPAKDVPAPAETPQPDVQTETPAPEPTPVATVEPTPPQAPAPVTGCGADPEMAYIYKVESGCRTDAVNPIGCIGLGQACPGGKLPCSMSDWDCQNNWFVNYAISRYGSIHQAYLFRISHNWW